MFKSLLFIVAFLYSFNSLAQDTIFVRRPVDWISGSTNYTTDTTLIGSYRDRLVMAGTTIIPNTSAQWDVAATFGMLLNGVSASDCLSDGEKAFDPDFINFIVETDSTLTVSTTIHDNCCYQFLCDVSMVEDSIINLTCVGYGWTICGCHCCFGLDYHFKKNEFPADAELKAFMINGDRKTLKPIKIIR